MDIDIDYVQQRGWIGDEMWIGGESGERKVGIFIPISK